MECIIKCNILQLGYQIQLIMKPKYPQTELIFVQIIVKEGDICARYAIVFIL